MVWGCMAGTGYEHSVSIEGLIDRMKYFDVWKPRLNDSVEKQNLPETWILKQYNEFKLTALVVHGLPLYNSRKQLQSSPQGPEFNSIKPS